MIIRESITILKRPSNACQVCHTRDLCLSSSLNQDELSRFNDLVGHLSPFSRGERLFTSLIAGTARVCEHPV